MLLLILLLAVLQAISAIATADTLAPLDKPAAWPDLKLIRGVLNTLPEPGARVRRWKSDNISQGCYERIVSQKQDPATFKQYTVLLGDCEEPWYICQQEGANPRIEKVAQMFSKIPVGMRQFVGDVVHFKEKFGASSWGSVMVLGGDAALEVATLIHEASHSVDHVGDMGIKSEDQAWLDAYDQDSHVADEYAKTNQAENFAQYAGLIIYDRTTNYTLETTEQYSWIIKQMQAMAQAGDGQHVWGDQIFATAESGKKCGHRWEHTPMVDPLTGVIVPQDAVGNGTSHNRRIIVKKPPTIDPASGAFRSTNCTYGLVETVQTES